MIEGQNLDQAKRHPDVVKNIIKKDGRKGAIPYSPSNPPPYPVTSVNGQQGDVLIPQTEGGRIWYATCSTASGTGAKVATSSTGDFVLATGSMARVKFTTSNTAANPTISIDGSTAKTIQPKSGTSGMANLIAAGEVVDLVYDGTNFIMTKGSSATTTFYGITKLNSATNSTSTTEAATPSAVKSAYDLADGKVSKAGDTMSGALTVSSGNITASAGSITAGTDGDTASERQIMCRSGAGTLYLYSQASATGNRGLYVPAHGTGAAKSVISIDTNNNCSFNGNAATATNATNDKDGKDLVKGYVQVYNSRDLGGQTATFTVNDLAASGNGVAMVNAATDNPMGGGSWVHVLNLAWQKGVNTSWISQLAMKPDSTGGGGIWYRASDNTIIGKAWKRLFDNSMTIPMANGGTGGTSLATARANLQMPRYPYYYYGSDSENANGWYKMCTVSQSSWSDCNLNLLFTSGYSRVAVGLLNVRVRCNNTTANALQGFHWMFRKGFAPGDVYFKDNGNNTWCLYVRQTVQRYGRIQVQILTQTGTTSRIDYAQYFADNATKESAAPTGGAASADGVVLLAKTASGLTSADSTASIRKTLSLGTTDISAYRMIQITVYSSVAGVEKQCSQVIFPSYYDGGRISLGWYSDVNTTYYMCTDVTLVGSSFNIYRAWYSNYSAPSFKVVGIY